MILHKWNEALIDWVNCLSLTGRISDIEELKNGEFFRLLLKKLTASEGIIECASDSFDDIYSVLEKEFPLYGVREIGRDDSRLSYIASLLLLLSVTKEETPMFQSNLCENLSHDSQVKIKCFLESCLESTNELNHSYLKTVIEGDAVSYEQTSAKIKDNVSIKTPMKDFFDSPRQTNKLKRDLKRLESENETLLLDKLELEDELRIEKEKRQRIEDALSQKSEQVLKLREELQDFIQNSSSKADEDDISSQSVSAIKSELRELEIYVTALQEEKTALFEEKEKLQEKIITLQSKSKDLELQTVYSETKQQELLAMLHKRDEEVSSLKEHCAELEEKINALPSALNMSIESDTSLPLGTISSPFGGERLSHAVVDVKLAEVEEENNKFKDQVKLLINERDILKNQLKELQETLAKEKEEGKSSRLKIESLMVELEANKESNSFKEKSLLEFEIKLNEKEILIENLEKIRKAVITEKKQLESKILSLNNNIEILEETKGELLRNNSDYKIQLLELSGKLSALEMHLDLKEKNLLNLREELAARNILAESMSQEMQKCKEEIEIMKEKGVSMEKTISLKDKECDDLMEKINSRDAMIEKFENDVRSNEKFIEELGEKLREKTNLIHSLKSGHEALEAEKKQLKNELEHINSQIIEKDSVAEKAKQEIIEYRDKLEKMIEELKDAKDSCILKENALLDITHQLSECNNKIKSLEETKVAIFTEKKELESSLRSLKEDMKLMEEAKAEILQENSHYKNQMLELTGKLKELETNLESKKNHLLTLKEQLAARNILDENVKQEMQRYQKEIEKLKEESDSQKEMISLKDKECDDLMEKVNSRDAMIEKFENDVRSNEKFIEELGEKLREKTNLIHSLKSGHEALEAEKKQLKNELEHINSQIIEKDSVAEKANQEIIEYRDKLEKMIEELKDAKDSCILKENALLDIKHQLSECNDKMKSLEETEVAIFTEKKELESSLRSLKEDMKLIEEAKAEILQENSHYKNQMLELTGKLKELETNLESKKNHLLTLKEQLAARNILDENVKQEMQRYQKEIEKLKEESDSQKEMISLKDKECDDLMEKVNSRDAMIEKFENDVRSNEKFIEELGEKLREKTNLIHSLKSGHEALEAEKKQLKNELEHINSQIIEKDSVAEKANQEIIEYRDRLEKMIEELKDAKDSCILKENALLDITHQLSECNDKIKSLEETEVAIFTEKKELESSLRSLKEDMKLMEEAKAEILQENSHYKNQMLELTGKLKELETNLESKKNHLLTLKEKLAARIILDENVLQEMQRYQEEIEKLKEKSDSQKEMISLKDKECDDLMEKINSRDAMIEKFENDVRSNEKFIEELGEKLREKTNLIHSLKSGHEALEAEKKQLKNELEHINSQIIEKDSVAEKANQEIIEYRDKLEKMIEELKDAKDSCILKENALLNIKHQLSECNDKIKSLEETEVAIFTEKKELESSLRSLKEDMKLMEEAKAEILQENSYYKNQMLELTGKLKELETNLESKKNHLLTLKEQLAARNILDENVLQEMQRYQEEIEKLKEESDSQKAMISLKDKECDDLMEKINSRDAMIEKFENDVRSNEKFIEELGEKLREKTNLIHSLKSGHEALEAEKKQLKNELEHINSQIIEKDSVAEKANQEIIEYRDKLEKMIEELKDAKDSCILKENALLNIKHQLSECNDKIKSLEKIEVACLTEKKEFESSILSLRAHVKLMEETKEEILKENSHYKSQALDSGSKLPLLEIRLEELEKNVTILTSELSTKNCLVKKMEEMIKDFQDEVESMKEGISSSNEAIALHEKANHELKQKIIKTEGTIISLEATEKVLMTEKKEFLCLVDEQRKTIDVLQQNLDSLNEEKILLESELSRWKAQSEAFKEMLEDIKIQSYVKKVELVDNDDAVKRKIVSNGTENESEHPTLSENASSELEAVGSNLKDAIAQTSCEYKDKNDIFNGDLESFSPESVRCLLNTSGDETKLRQLDVGKLMQLINSWHDVDTTLEKLRVVEHLLKAKICSLWESIPRIQSKLKGNLNAVGSPQISMKETDQAKEVIMRIISMVRSLEKCNSSLEKELVHASSNAVSWGLQGIQNQFNVVTSTPNTFLTNDECNLEGGQKKFCSSLDTLRDKVNQVLEDVNSSVEIFKEVEHRSANVAEALEYLKKNCLYEKELLSDVDYEGFQVALTEEESRERFIKAMEEMERAKEDLERIAHESRKEVESLQSDKENLEQELQSMAARCCVLESKLEMSEKHVELAVRETQQRVQKIFEKKLEATKEKWKSLYLDDLKKYEEECKLRKQFEESFKKYRSLAEDYEKRLAEATAQSADLKSKVQNLQHQKSCLEMKLRESSARNFMEDEHRESLDSACKSNFTDVMANYFASKNISSPSHSTYDSHRDTNQDSISRSFSRESVQSSLPSGMGQVFCAEDEEGEWFNATYLNDLNEGKCIMPSSRASNAESCFGVLRESNKQRIRNPTNEDTPNRRMKELMRRNTLCLPHLKSSYPTETQFNDPKNFPDELLKGNFSLKAPLLGDKQPRRLSGNIYGDLRRKKDIGQTTYMKPGPPTPGKNRRTSLQGSEQGSEQGKIPSTPGRFRSWFARGKKTVPNSDVENVPFTPRTKQKGIFQRAMANLDRDGS